MASKTWILGATVGLLAGCARTTAIDGGDSGDSGDSGSLGDSGDSGAASGLSAEDLDGSWSGDWNNTTFDSTGAASLDITVDTGTKAVSFTLDLDGGVFGDADPAPFMLSGTYDATGMSVSTTGDSLFGDFTLDIDPDGDITGSGTPSVGPLSWEGTADASDIDLSYEIGDGSGGVFAEGTLTFSKDGG